MDLRFVLGGRTSVDAVNMIRSGAIGIFVIIVGVVGGSELRAEAAAAGTAGAGPRGRGGRKT